MKKIIFTVCLIVFLPFLSISSSHGAEALNKVVAVVNGEMITSYELQLAATGEIMQARLSPRNKADQNKIEDILRKSLDSMVMDLIVVQEAQRLKINAGDSEVDAEIKRVVERSKLTEEEFFKQIEKQGISKELMRSKITNRIISQRLMSNMVGRKIIVPKEEVEKYFAEHGGIVTGRSAQFALIIYPPNQDPKKWANAIKTKQISFEEAAKRVSIGPGRENGGKLGVIPWDELDQGWRNRLSKMSPGEISDVFKLDKMNAQAMLISKNEGTKATTLKEAYPEIEDFLRTPKLEARYKDYLAELKKKARIDIKL